jgi:diguanylate cyclase (GGDEF)-like protein
MLDYLPYLIYAIDCETNRLVYGNYSFQKKYPGWRDLPCHLLINGLDASCAHCHRMTLLSNDKPNGRCVEYEFFNELDDDWYQMQERAMVWMNGRAVHLVTAIDIGALKQTQHQLAEAHAELMLKHQELEHTANTDSLTQIYNREKLGRVFARELQIIQQDKSTFSIISVDLDRFKQINDSFGHATGDAVLVKVARTMKNSLRSTDYIGRWGGEEFLILCPQTSHTEAMQLAERIRTAVANQSYATGQNHSISLGVASYQDGDSLDSLLHRSDQAMYRAKQTGRNRVCSETEILQP